MTGVKTSRVPALDGIRGLAILIVVAAHSFTPYRSGGGLGVAAFFTLSGFLIATLLLAERDRGKIDALAFYVRRVRRLGPALVVMLTVLVALGVVGVTTALPAVAYVQNFSMLAHLDQVTPINHTWSLAIEEQFYLLFPLTLVVLSRRLSDRGLLVVYGVAAVASAVWRVTSSAVWHVSWAHLAPDTNACLVLCGVTLALAVRRWTWRPATSVTWPLLVLLVPLGFVPLSWETMRVGVVPVVASVCAAVLIAANLEQTAGWLTSKPMRYLGRRSYGLYLWHYPILVGWQHVGSPWWALVPCLALAWGLTEASWRWVERPVLARLSQSPIDAAEPPVAGGARLGVVGHGFHSAR